MEDMRFEQRHALGIERLTPGKAAYFYTNERQDEDGMWVYDVWRVSDADHAKAEIDAQINAETDHKILTGYRYNGQPVWLSAENQQNFTGLYLGATTTGGAILPITAKIGERNGKPIYHTFVTIEDVAAFYLGGIAYINECLRLGQMRKDAIRVVI